jgi:hypothetical protein
LDCCRESPKDSEAVNQGKWFSVCAAPFAGISVVKYACAPELLVPGFDNLELSGETKKFLNLFEGKRSL